MVDVPNSASDDVLSFVRGEKGERVFAVFNLSPRAHELAFETQRHHGDYSDALTGENISFGAEQKVTLAPWGYRIFREAD